MNQKEGEKRTKTGKKSSRIELAQKTYPNEPWIGHVLFGYL